MEAHNLIEIDLASFEAAIKKAFGMDIKNSTKVINGLANQVYRAEHLAKVVFIRINKNPNVFPLEIAGYRLLSDNHISVPQVIGYQEKPSVIGYPTMIVEAAEGTSIDKAGLTPDQEAEIYQEVGKTLKNVHQIKLEGFGELEIVGGKLRGVSPDWDEYWGFRFKRLAEDLAYLIGRGFIRPSESDQVRSIMESYDSIPLDQASLIHKDLHPSHIFIKHGEVSGIIDLGAIAAGDPKYDIANCFAFQSESQMENFKKGYGDLSNDPLVLKYLLVIAIAKARFRDTKGLERGTERALNKMRATLETLKGD